MDDVDDVLFKRLSFLRNELEYLHAERDSLKSFEAFNTERRVRLAVERSLHIAVEACLDIGRRVIAIEGFRFPNDNKDVFKVLVEEKIIPTDLAETMYAMAGFRNVIVHEYVEIDNATVYGTLKKRLGDFEAFSKAIQSYIRKP